jgi:hypothetical protein
MRGAADGRLTGRHSTFPPDCDWVDEQIELLVLSVGFDATLLSKLDADKIVRNRLWKKMVLARYARIDPFAWEERDLRELDEHFEVIVEILKAEGGSTEDH